jgi:hypothetical protein
LTLKSIPVTNGKAWNAPDRVVPISLSKAFDSTNSMVDDIRMSSPMDFRRDAETCFSIVRAVRFGFLAMAKSNQKKRGIELEPDAWQRFERAVDVVAKSPPQHRKKKKAAAGNKRKKAKTKS